MDVLPLEHRMGWDGVDEFRANARGWKTRTFKEFAFRHHRREGERDGAPRRARIARAVPHASSAIALGTSGFARYGMPGRIRPPSQ